MSNEYDDLIAAQPAEQASDYDAELQLYQDQQRTQLRSSLAGAVQVNPDQYAQAKSLSSQTGIPAEVVHRNMPEVQQGAKVNEYDQMLQATPALRQSMQNPEFAKVAHDDLPVLTQLENSVARGWRSLKEMTPAALVANRASLVQQMDAIDRGDKMRSDQLGSVGEMYLEASPAERAQFRQQFASGLPQEIAQGAGTIANLEQQKRAFPMAPTVEQALNAPTWGGTLKGILRHPLDFAASELPEGIIGSAPGLVASIPATAGGPGAVADVFGLSSFAQTLGPSVIDELGRRGIDVSNASALSAAMNNPKLLQPAVDAAVKRAGVSGAFGFLTGGLAARFPSLKVQVPLGAATGAAQPAVEAEATGEKTTPGEVLAGAVSGAASTPLLAAVTHAVGRLGSRGSPQASAERATGDAQKLAEIAQQAATSKLRERDPQSFQQFVDTAAQSGPVQDVYVDAKQFAQTLMQHGVDPRSVPAVAEQLPEALSLGGDLRIPIGEFASHIAGEKYAQDLIPHLRTSPDGMSAAEAQTFEQSGAEQFQKDAAEALAAHSEDSEFHQSSARVEEHIFDRLTAANRFTGDVNRAYAQMVRDFYTVQAHKLRTTPEELFNRYPLDIKAESVIGDHQLDQGNKPEDNDDYGRQLVEELTRDTGVGREPRGRTGTASRSGAQRGTAPEGSAETVYRGSDVRLADSHFNPESLGRASGNPSSGLGVWFTSSRPDAARYGPVVAEHQLELANPKRIPVEDFPAFDSLRDAQNYARQLRQQGHDGIVMDASHLGGPKHYIAFSPESVRSTKTFDQDARGQITFQHNLSQPTVISLLRNADLSTFLHESGHFFLEVYSDIAGREGAPEAIRGDMDSVLKWFGVKDLTTWRDMPLEQKRQFHEQFARGFEAYLFDGQAPNHSMQTVFSRFRSWMLNVYRRLTNLNVDLTPEVRGVFDRMLATDQQLKVSQSMRAYQPLFESAKQAGMTAAEWQSYQDLGADASTAAQEELQKRSLRDMRWLSGAHSKALKELQASADEKRKATRAEVAGEVQEEPVYRAIRFITKGTLDAATKLNNKQRRVSEQAAMKGTKLSLPALKEMYGDEANAPWRYLDTGRYGHVTAADGLHPDLVAELFGFKSGDELVRSILEADPIKDVIDARTDQRMLERHGDLTDPATMARAADAAVHNEARSRFVATELRALQRAMNAREKTPKGGSVNILAKAAKDFAAATIGRKQVRDIKPAMFDAAETRAAQAAEKALKKGDLNAAVMEKRNQLINGYAARAARDALEEIDRGLQYLRKFDKAAVREKINLEYRDQIDALLDRYDLRKSVTGPQLRKREQLAAFVDRMAGQGYEPGVPDYLLDEANRQHYSTMPVEQFRGLVDGVKSIEHLGRLKNKLLDLQEERELDAVAAEAAKTMEDLPKKVGPQSKRGLTRIEKKWANAKAAGRSLGASLLKMEQMMDWLDARNPNGIFNRVVFRRISDAGVRENELNRAMSERFKALVSAVPDEALKSSRVFVADNLIDSVTGQPAKFTKKELLALAGNVGNESNLQKVLAGEQWNEAALWDFLHKNMTKGDWDFVQGLGNAFESLWPEKLAMSRRLGNTNPEKIQPRPFQTPHGEYDGWYWPMVYDPARSQDVAERGARKGDALFENIYRRANTDTGRMNTRVEGYARPVLFDLDAIPRVIRDEIHDLAYREPIMDADKFLSHPSVRSGVIDALGQEYYDQLRPWLQSIAGDKAVDGAALKFWQGLAHGARTRATMAGLGFRLTTMLVHGTSAGLESAAEIGPRWLASGLADFRNPLQWAANKDFVFERSGEMRNRMHEVDRDIREHLRELEIRMADPATGAAQRGLDLMKSHAYYGIAMLDMASALPTWMGAYKKAMTPEERGGLGMGEADAVYYADKSVRNAHGGTGAKDLAAVQRGNEFFKLLTMFYSFWNHNVNRLRDTARLARELPATARSGNMAKFRGDLGMVIMRSLIYTLGIQVIHTALQPHKDDEGWGVWAAKQLAGAATSGIPVVRDIAAHFLEGKDYSVTPAAQIVTSVTQSAHDAQLAALGQETSPKWVKHAMETAGYVFGLPTGQAASTTQFLWDVGSGRQDPQSIADWWHGLLQGDMHHK